MGLGLKLRKRLLGHGTSYSELTQSIEVIGFASIEETAGPVVFQIVNP